MKEDRIVDDHQALARAASFDAAHDDGRSDGELRLAAIDDRDAQRSMGT
jgi:hypothetical protein